jgi:hypothetical protein
VDEREVTQLERVLGSRLRSTNSRAECSTRKNPVEMPGWPLGWANGRVLAEEMTIRAFGLLGGCGDDAAVRDGSGVAMVAPFRLSLTG